MTVTAVKSPNAITNSVHSVTLNSSSREKESHKAQEAAPYSSIGSAQKQEKLVKRSSIAQPMMNSVAPNHVDRKLETRHTSDSHFRGETLVTDHSHSQHEPKYLPDNVENHDNSQSQLIMSDQQYNEILTEEPAELSAEDRNSIKENEEPPLDTVKGILKPSPHPTIDTLQSIDSYFSAVSQNTNSELQHAKNNNNVDSSNMEEAVSMISSKRRIKAAQDDQEQDRIPSPPSRSTSLPMERPTSVENEKDTTPAQAIAQMVRGRTIVETGSNDSKSTKKGPPGLIMMPDGPGAIPRIEEHLASPISVPSEYLKKNAVSLDMDRLMEHSHVVKSKPSLTTEEQISKRPSFGSNVRQYSSTSRTATSRSVIPAPQDIYIPVPNHPANIDGNAEVILKTGIILCTKSARDASKEPIMYKTSVASRYSRMRRQWREFELVLTNKELKFLITKPFELRAKKLVDSVSFQNTKSDTDITLSLLSSLDYTIQIEYTHPTSRNVTTTILKAQSQESCMDWYMAIYRMLPTTTAKPILPWVEIFVPSRHVQIRIPLQEEGIITNEVNVTAHAVKKAAINLLQSTEQDATETDELEDVQDMGLCWTAGDRIEWIPSHRRLSQILPTQLVISPQSIEQEHNLELRTVEHAMDHVDLRNGDCIWEPPSIAGYLLRQNNHRGKEFRQKALSGHQVYVCTQQHLLFFVLPSHIDVLEHSDRLAKGAMGSMSTRSVHSFQRSSSSNLSRRNQDPITYSATEHITNHRSHHDQVVRKSVQRHAAIIKRSSHLIDLLEITDVRPCLVDEDRTSFRFENTSRIIGSQSSRFGGTRSQNSDDRCFELEMNNGSASVEAMEEWVQRLHELVQYWKARKQADLATHVAVKQANRRLVPLHGAYHDKSDHPFPEENMALFMNEVEEVDAPRSIANSQIWNYCTVSGCQSIMKCGPLYVKHAIRRTFAQKYFVLTNNECLHHFQMHFRNVMTGQILPTSTHERQGVIDLRQAYIYSGRQCMIDKVAYDVNRPNRIFADGLVSNDDVKDCIFVIWQPKRSKSIFKQSSPNLATKGNLAIFMARSRQEKEEWVWAIQQCIDRLLRPSDTPARQTEPPNSRAARSPTNNQPATTGPQTQDTMSLHTI